MAERSGSDRACEALDPEQLQTIVAQPTPWTRLRRGRQQLNEREFAAAQSTLESLVADHPEFTEGRGWLGVLQARVGMHRSAVRSLAPVVTAPQATGEMLDAHATCLARGGRWEQLRAFLDERGDELAPGWVHPGGRRRLDHAFLVARRLLAPDRQPDLSVVYHLPFCAGTSVTVGLETVYGTALHVVGRKLGQHLLKSIDPEALASAESPQVIRLHHPYPLDTAAATPWVTTLRQPVARFISGFHKRLAPHRLPTLDFRGEPSVEATIANAERWQLHDPMARELAILHPELRSAYRSAPRLNRPVTVRFEEQLDYLRVTAELAPERLHALADEVLSEQFAVVGTVEHFDASYLAIGAVLGLWAMPDPVRVGRSEASQHVPDEGQVARIERLHEVDTALYTAWQRRFEERFAPVLAALG